MAVMPRQTAFTPVSASGLINVYATEIERIAIGTFSNLTNTAKPRFFVARSTDLTGIVSGSDTTISWQTEFSDPRNMWDPGVPTVITVQDSGDWLLFGQLRWSGATGVRVGRILHNGTNPNTAGVTKSSVTIQATTAPEGTSIGVFAFRRLTAGDQLYLSCWQNSGSNQSLLLDFGGTFFSGAWLGPAS